MYRIAAQRASDDPAILFELAQLHVEEDGASAESIQLLEQVIRSAPTHAQAHLLLGDAYMERRRRSEAIEHYKRARELTTPDSQAGRQARRKLGKHHISLPERQAQGWGETLRRMGGLMLIPGVAALVNARLVPWQVSLLGWGELVLAMIGAYLWVCATDVPRNPGMQAIFGQTGVKGLQRQILVGTPGAVLWTGALGLILLKT